MNRNWYHWCDENRRITKYEAKLESSINVSKIICDSRLSKAIDEQSSDCCNPSHQTNDHPKGWQATTNRFSSVHVITCKSLLWCIALWTNIGIGLQNSLILLMKGNIVWNFTVEISCKLIPLFYWIIEIEILKLWQRSSTTLICQLHWWGEFNNITFLCLHNP